MPFDSLHAPPEWVPPRRDAERDRPLSRTDRLVAAILGAALFVITVANCKVVLGLWHAW